MGTSTTTSAPAPALSPQALLPLFSPWPPTPTQQLPPSQQQTLQCGGVSLLPLFQPQPVYSSVPSVTALQPLQGNVLQLSNAVLWLPLSRVLQQARAPVRLSQDIPPVAPRPNTDPALVPTSRGTTNKRGAYAVGKWKSMGSGERFRVLAVQISHPCVPGVPLHFGSGSKPGAAEIWPRTSPDLPRSPVSGGRAGWSQQWVPHPSTAPPLLPLLSSVIPRWEPREPGLRLGIPLWIGLASTCQQPVSWERQAAWDAVQIQGTAAFWRWIRDTVRNCFLLTSYFTSFSDCFVINNTNHLTSSRFSKWKRQKLMQKMTYPRIQRVNQTLTGPSSTPGVDSDHDYTIIGGSSPTHPDERWVILPFFDSYSY